MPDFPYCLLCGNVNRADLGPVTGVCLDGRACRRRQAGVEPVNPDARCDCRTMDDQGGLPRFWDCAVHHA